VARDYILAGSVWRAKAAHPPQRPNFQLGPTSERFYCLPVVLQAGNQGPPHEPLGAFQMQSRAIIKKLTSLIHKEFS
jgi:hypothetical protein